MILNIFYLYYIRSLASEEKYRKKLKNFDYIIILVIKLYITFQLQTILKKIIVIKIIL